MSAAAAAAATAALDNSTKNTLKLENTEKRDTLIAIEKKYQAQWKEKKVFEVDAPSISEIPADSLSAAELRVKHPKFYGTMAFPYMNGSPHAGHSFTASKIEFMTGVARMEGKRSLFPLAFHCTGMPIKACADKLVDDIKKFGKYFENYKEEDEVEDAASIPVATQAKEDPSKFSGKKSKAASKAVKLKYQFQIMMALGIPLEEVHKFSDPDYWLQYFPPLWIRDLDSLGARIDWRRGFVTTDVNPYFDAFVRWQMNRLHEMGKIMYGNRYTVYSPKDGQPCMDHDRTEGEGIGPQEYTALKLKVKEWSPKGKELVQGKIEEDASVYFVPATMRPETMYGQTCCYVGPSLNYGIFKVKDKEYYVTTKRGAWNMAFQGTFFDMDHFPCDQSELPLVVEAPGSAFVGTLVNAPLSAHKDGVRILPMETVSASKGTGVVTSVPSDSPDDFATFTDLAKKADYYGIKKEWAELEVIPIIETPSYGNLTAPALVKQLKINSPKDATQLAQAKELAYNEGFYKGTMLVGDFKGEPVQAAKDKVRKQLIESGDAFPYADPMGKVVSRSGDDCVVAYLGQWFLNYGPNDPQWLIDTQNYVANCLNTYLPETRHGFEKNLEWLNRWACARTYGLGSKLPWDPQFLVESLSDSTIYQAYYAISHLLQNDRYGSKPGPLGIKPEQLTDDAWDYIFARRDLRDDLVQNTGISKQAFLTMRREFEYWYPLDVRVSGKDLIQNHLTFWLYVHIAMFPEEYWPRSVRANGHLLLNGEKMSKSTGNFLTLKDAVDKYGADATRIAFADAGDGIEDANFEESVANSNILRLHTLKEWVEDVVKDASLRTGPADAFVDKLFDNEMNVLVREARRHYSDTNFKLALKAALYEFTSARDFYREQATAAGIGMHKDVILRYIELQALLITPIAPHWAEYVWLEVLHKPKTIQHALFPEVPEVVPALSAAIDYIRSTSSNISSSEASFAKKISKGKAVTFDPRKPKKLTVFAAKKFPTWQEKYIDLVREAFDDMTISINDKELNANVGKLGEMKKAMPFVQGLKKRLIQSKESPERVFNRQLAFDETEVLRNMMDVMKKVTGCKVVEVISVEEGGKVGNTLDGEHRDNLPPVAESAIPGQPSFHFENISEDSV
ncbi:cytosolic leucyl tRNA synthetase [Ophidiomyces ophidiicola]|uniref:cytosolic leucyl tRNA synthetase n=1 Tax=Ophidiomyces ophidiicola TaxID=1387563 RepID=UPI0020C523C0|nr:cytosolic leucyl tRNA synthetase [Ophidiomyces ophidiicola]KAI1940343.1 cytosolic leucyl tRNA synthetase [Ophidiomyces ophidiicola]KAI1946790.1 cytosolic leucyl tRNA synthetase [Ophidiomyces ophidiicola]KAI2048101.1 cytosolic leucyl tRNA synthetase [Ophidiomyces ophidiicola]KAI2048420.1 cytosolic leucyl tRNA synthetase [Ophidiomyces ophidiicola]KAI2055883.1 cytosolic leucyl tRNA synthetase [Ophidiomyces ophidiicola]